jgi:hypothetical protein
MRAINLDSDNPRLAEWQWIIRQVKLMGFTGSYVTDGPLPAADRTRLQVRSFKNDAPRNMVSKYRENMIRGDIFPPILVTRDGIVIDGSTRVAAARPAGRKTISQIRLDVDYEGAGEDTRERLRKLGAGMNEMNGKSMAKGDIEELIAMNTDPGEDPKAVAAKIHYPLATVRRVFKIQEGRRWLTRLGVEDPDGRLSAEHMKLFAGWDEKMTDVILAHVANLARDAKLTSVQTAELGQKVIGLGSEVAKLNFLDSERVSADDRIRGVTTKPDPAAQLRQALGGVRRFADSIGIAVEHKTDPELRLRHVQELKEAQLVIEQVLKEQNTQDAQLAKIPVVTSPFWKK